MPVETCKSTGPQPATAGAAPRNDPKENSGTFSNQVVWMRLADIRGDHSLVKELQGALKLPPFALARSECIPKDVVRILVERIPLLTCKEKNAIVCIGNIRLYRLASSVLDKSELVQTIQYSGSLSNKRRERLKQGLLIETFLMPAIFGRRAHELQALNSAWERAADANLLSFWAGVGSLAELYREDPSLMKRKRAARRG